MKHNQYSFQSKVWRYREFGGWHFVNVPKEISFEIKERFGTTKRRGWGSIPITATLGKTTWDTSIFPSKQGEYLLALKQAVREKEAIQEDDLREIIIEIRNV